MDAFEKVFQPPSSKGDEITKILSDTLSRCVD